MQIHHIGYLVSNIAKAKRSFESLGFHEEYPVVFDDYRKINILFMVNGGYRIELIESADSNSVVSDLYKRYKNSPYHICYISDGNFDEDIRNFTDAGAFQIDVPHEAVALNNKRVTFFMFSTIGIIELLEA